MSEGQAVHTLTDKSSSGRRALEHAALWTVYKGDRKIECRLRARDGGGVELRVLRDGVWCAGGRFSAAAEAVAHGDQLLIDLQGTGWKRED